MIVPRTSSCVAPTCTMRVYLPTAALCIERDDDDDAGLINQSINQSFLEWPKWPATARSTTGVNVNVSNKSQETIGRIDVVSAFSGTLAATQRR